MVAITFASRETNKFLFTKDLASNCLKVDKDLLRSWGREFKLFNFKKINFEYFIPFYNMFKSLKELAFYLYDYNIAFNELDKLNIIVPMANFEKREYMQNPSIYNLFKVLRKGYKRLHNAKYERIVNNDGNVVGEVLFEENNGNIEVLETYGSFDMMLNSEIIDYIKKKKVSKKEKDIEELKELKEEIMNLKTSDIMDKQENNSRNLDDDYKLIRSIPGYRLIELEKYIENNLDYSNLESYEIKYIELAKKIPLLDILRDREHYYRNYLIIDGDVFFSRLLNFYSCSEEELRIRFVTINKIRKYHLEKLRSDIKEQKKMIKIMK